MQILNKISLKPYNTFGIDVLAKHFVAIDNINDLIAILKNKAYPNKLILGGGSNILLTQNIKTLVTHICLKGISIISENDDFAIVKANAGENWHEFVLWCLERNFGGIENLSLIPGNVGSAPIQNIGAYGIEIKDTFLSCEAISLHTTSIKKFNKDACNFGYRSSIFKQVEKGNFIITSVTFKLTKRNHKLNMNYGNIESKLKENEIKTPTIQDISKAVISIRKNKLPNPKEVGNSGSFFKNPIISQEQFKILEKNFNDIPNYKISENEIKIPAGWLIEKAGFKGKRFGNYGVHKKQALVLVNYGNAKGQDILNLSKLIQKTILRLFDISIETEVNIL